MHHEYRRRIQYLLNEKRKAETELRMEEETKKNLSWLERVFTANSRLENEIVLRHLIQGIDHALLDARFHYMFHYTKPGRNPFDFPKYILVTIISHGVVTVREHSISMRYADFMK